MLLLLILAVMLPVFAAESQVQETILPNGLKALTKEVHAAPVASFHVWYKVGARNERLGKTGISHFTEHMLFDSLKNFKKGDIFKLIDRYGGTNNGATWIDFTYYWETLASDKMDLAMRIESDRMTNALFNPKEHKSEMTVVRSELEGHENEPDSLIYYELYSAAFKAHPYQWPTIGWRHDVETITRDDLYKYYKTFYHPNNATVVVVGDFDTEKALAMVKKYFGGIPRGTEPPKVTAVEPEQLGERRAVVSKAGNASRVMIGFHTPAIGHPDIYVLDIMERILSGGTSSRLYEGLVDKQLVTSAWASSNTYKDPNLFLLGGTARDGVKIEDVEKALLTEADRLKTEPVTDEELQKAKNQLEASFIYSHDSVTDQADQLGYYETIYSWRYLDTYLENVQKVTKDDIQRVAQKYFTEKNRTVATFIPDQPPTTSSQSPASRQKYAAYTDGKQPVASGQPDSHPHPDPLPPAGEGNGKGAPSPVSASDTGEGRGEGKSEISNLKSQIRPTRVVLDNGMVVLIHENRSNPTLALKMSIDAGSMRDPAGKDGLAGMTADLLLKGTTHRTADQIAVEQDFVGMGIDNAAETEFENTRGHSLSKHFDKLLDLMSDALRNPTFPSDEFDKMKARKLSGLKEEQDDPRALAFRTFYGSVFPKGHPYHQPTVDEQMAELTSIMRDDVAGFHKSYYGPKNAILTIVGDVDTQEALAEVKKYFGDWKPDNSSERPAIPDTPLQASIEKKVVFLPDKSQADVVLGYAAGLKRSDPDYYAATIMNYILGGGGAMNSRLGNSVRGQMGLAYDVYSMFDANRGAGPWLAGVGTNPENADKAINTVLDQVTRMRDKGVTKAELDDAVAYIVGSLPVRLETNDRMANFIHSVEYSNLGTDYIQNYGSYYRSVTLEQVNAAAKKYLHPDRYTLVIAGSYKEAK